MSVSQRGSGAWASLNDSQSIADSSHTAYTRYANSIKHRTIQVASRIRVGLAVPNLMRPRLASLSRKSDRKSISYPQLSGTEYYNKTMHEQTVVPSQRGSAEHDITLEHVLAGQTCSPASLKDLRRFMEQWVGPVSINEAAMMNALDFLVAARSYEKDFFALPFDDQLQSPSPYIVIGDLISNRAAAAAESEHRRRSSLPPTFVPSANSLRSRRSHSLSITTNKPLPPLPHMSYLSGVSSEAGFTPSTALSSASPFKFVLENISDSFSEADAVSVPSSPLGANDLRDLILRRRALAGVSGATSMGDGYPSGLPMSVDGYPSGVPESIKGFSNGLPISIATLEDLELGLREADNQATARELGTATIPPTPPTKSQLAKSRLANAYPPPPSTGATVLPPYLHPSQQPMRDRLEDVLNRFLEDEARYPLPSSIPATVLTRACLEAQYTTHPAVLLPIATLLSNEFSTTIMPAFFADATQNLAPRTANGRLRSGTASLSFGIILGIFLLFTPARVSRPLRLLCLPFVCFGIGWVLAARTHFCVWMTLSRRKETVQLVAREKKETSIAQLLGFTRTVIDVDDPFIRRKQTKLAIKVFAIFILGTLLVEGIILAIPSIH